MNSEPITIRGRHITTDVLDEIRQVIEQNRELGRTHISLILCQKWGWRQSNGRLKGMACRDLLLRLERMGLISLPPRKREKVNRKIIVPVSDLFNQYGSKLLSGRIDEYRRIELEMVRGTYKEKLWDYLVDQYHYLGCSQIVGSYLKYLVYLDNQLASCFGWGSAAWKVGCRDRFIGWTAEQRRNGLHCISNNVRFLILPWVQVEHFASKTLALSTRVLKADWQKTFSEELVLVETFVDCSRFRGTCYRAANWIYLGQTRGSAKRGASYRHHGLTKAVFVYPLVSDFRERLCR